MNDLTKSQQYILSVLYKEYLLLTDTLSKSKSNYFGECYDLHNKMFNRINKDDFVNDCFRLHHLEYLVGQTLDNSIFDIRLTDKTIIIFENKFKNGIKSVIEFISSINIF